MIGEKAFDLFAGRTPKKPVKIAVAQGHDN
jgi:hypothetical protein